MNALIEKGNTRIFTRKIAFLAMLFTLPILILFICFDRVDQGIGAWICAGIVAGTSIIWWDLRRSVWFWVAIAFATLLQIPFIVFVPWTNKYMSFVSLLPFGFIDYLLVYGCMKLAQKFADSSRKNESEE